MGRSPSQDDNGLKKGPWTVEEDEMLTDYISRHGHGSWSTLPKLAGLNRCGKSCRLRWTNYLRPDIKRGKFSQEEERIIIHLHSILGNKWSRIAGHLPGRTDNEIKNFWNTHLRKKLLQMGIDPNTHMPRTDLNHLANLSPLLCSTNLGNLMNPLDNALRLQADAAQLAKLQLLQNLLQVINTSTVLPNIPNIQNTSLLGTTQNLNPFETDLSNGSVPPATPQEFLNLGSVPLQAPSENQAFAGSWACYEGEFIQEFLNIHDDSTKNSYGNQTVSSLPALASASTETSTVNDEMESKSNPNYVSEHSPTSTIFEAWEKLMDDESSGSYWKEILD